MKAIVVAVLNAVLSVLYAFFSLFPTKQRIVCLSRQSDNPPLDFLLIKEELAKSHPDYKLVILAKQLHNPLPYAFHMVKQVYYLATSKAILLDSYCIAVSLLNKKIKAPVIQMWHAMGNMKKFGYTALGSDELRNAETAKLLHMHEGYDSILVSSLGFAKDFATGFNVDPSIMYECPLPKADLLIDSKVKDAKRAEILTRYPQLASKKNIVYCPTFRRTPSPNEHEAMTALLAAVDFDRYNLVYKAHPVSTQRFDDTRVLQDYDHSLDMLYIADYVISDYSTVIYEAGLLDVPVFLYTYDWNHYQQKLSLYIDIEHDVPTLFTDSADDIMQAIERDEFDHAAYARFMRGNIMVPQGETCTQRVIKHALDMMS